MKRQNVFNECVPEEGGRSSARCPRAPGGTARVRMRTPRQRGTGRRGGAAARTGLGRAGPDRERPATAAARAFSLPASPSGKGRSGLLRERGGRQPGRGRGTAARMRLCRRLTWLGFAARPLLACACAVGPGAGLGAVGDWEISEETDLIIEFA